MSGVGVGLVLGPAALLSPAIALGAAGVGVYSSSGIAIEVFLNNTSTIGQKASAGALLLASVAGARTAYKHLNAVRGRPQVLQNKLLGSRSVENFVRFMRDHGVDVVGTEIYARSPFHVTGRIFDVVIRVRDTGELVGIEIKSTPRAFRRFNKAQEAADEWISKFGGGKAFGKAARQAQIEGQRITSTMKILWADQ